MVLEAGVQLFEGRPFVVEDFKFASRSSCPTRPRACISRFPTSRTSGRSPSRAGSSRARRGRCTWWVRCAASARIAVSDHRHGNARDSRDEPVEVEGFYRYMSDLGLRYGEEFRPIRELSAGAGTRRAAWRCPKPSPTRRRICAASGALRWRVANLLRRGGDGGGSPARMKLPVRFARILFLRSPGAVASSVQACCNATRSSSKAGSGCMMKRVSLACSSMAFARLACPGRVVSCFGRKPKCSLSSRLGTNPCSLACRNPKTGTAGSTATRGAKRP